MPPDAQCGRGGPGAERGLVPTRNAGLDAVRTDVLERIDADSVPAPDWVEVVQRAFRDPDLAAATGSVLYYDLPDMVAGVSARRMDDSPAQFREYVGRFRRTYRAHRTSSPVPTAARVVLLLVSWPVKLWRRLCGRPRGPGCAVPAPGGPLGGN